MRHHRLSVVFLSLAAPVAAAQNYSIPWYSVDAGGGTSVGGPYSLSGTIGQHDAGAAASGGGYALAGGFWSAGANPCLADFNRDGEVNTQDVLAYLNAWVASESRADYNGDGTVNTQDFLLFLNNWTSGC